MDDPSTRTDSIFANNNISLNRLIVSIIFFLSGFTFSSWVVHIATLKSNLNLTSSELGTALFFNAIAALVSMPIAGVLVFYFGAKAITSIGGILYCMTFGILLLMPDFLSLVIILFFIGIAIAPLNLGMNAYGVGIEKFIARPIMSYFHAMYSIGTLSGSSIAVFVLSRGIEPILHLTTVAFIGFILFSVIFILKVNSIQREKAIKKLFILPRGPLVLMGLLTLFVLSAEGAVADWSSVFSYEVLKVNLNQAGSGFVMFSLGVVVGRLLGDSIIYKFGRVIVFKLGSMLAVIGFSLAIFSFSLEASAVGIVLAGLGISNLIPILFSAAGNIKGISEEIGITAVATAGYFGLLISPAAIGFVADWLGLKYTLSVFIFLMLIVVLFSSKINTDSNL